MTEENRPSLHPGDDDQPLSRETAQVNSDIMNPVSPTPQHSQTENPSSGPPPSPTPDPPSHSSSTSSPSPSAASDGKTELHKFLQIIKNDEGNADRLKAVLDGLEKDQIRQRSHHDGNKNAMHMAADRGMLWAVRQLLNYTPDDTSLLFGTDEDGRQPLHFACLRGHRDTADLLLQRGADIDARGNDRATPLDDACFKGHKDVVELLLSRGANTQVLDKSLWSPIRTAVGYQHLDIVEILLNENPAKINEGDKHGETPLHVASGKGCVDIMNLLLERGADIDKPDNDRETPLHSACRNGWERSARLLLKEQAKTDRTDNQGETPLHAASRKGHERVVAVLLEEHAAIDVTDDTGKTPLCAASEQGHVECVNILCEAGADCNIQADRDGGYNTALHYAFEPSEKENESPDDKKKNQSRIVAKLLAHGADPAIQNDEADTALHLAAKTGNWSAYKDILEAMKEGQNRLRNEWENTALGLALKSHPADILGLMMDSESASMFDSGDEVEALLWAAQNEENHHYLQSLFEERKHLRNKMPPTDTRRWSAIQWATYLELPEVLASLRNATPTITSGGEKPEIPTAGTEQEEFLKHWGPKAAVTECKAQDDESTLLTEFRSVQDVIYGTGPVPTTATKIERLGDDLFTWVHLPATNITWMNDLLKRILIEEPSCVNDSRSNNVERVNAFFESSWTQTPDATSKSRIMKPLCTTEPLPQTKDASSPDRFLQAIYMPYLALSRQQRGQYHTENDNREGKQSRNEQEKGCKQEENDGRDQNDVDLQRAYDAYYGLLKCYEGNVIHGSATLDESFYGFSGSQPKDAQQQEALHEDRLQTNEQQVVTKTIHPEGVAERSDWTLVRVNQLWVWVIGHKWLITATTHPMDQAEDSFLTDAIDYIEKRVRRVRSPLEMAKAVFAYSVDSYDRPPKSTVYETDHCIHKIFSDSINKIAREDARLFEDFCGYLEAKEPKEKDGPEGKEMGTKAAARLLAKIRNIFDELQTFRAIGKHQMRVWKKLKNGSSADNRRWESHVMSDIEDMIESAHHIKSNVEMTLSLAQRQIANNHTRESVKQGKTAIQQGRQSFQQGRTAMIFTAITAFCLTSSSLSSLFAMEVDSFHNVPYWASLPIFLVLAALLYILWLREIDRDDHVGGHSKEETDNSEVKEKRRVRGEKEDWNTMRGGLATWRRRRRESPSEV
ncbi:hypothetical protein LCI18_011564 [Fusarium solani-melongenae]|uniref:Uncharacterized protein n=1 Tax=Fusarium solani subsp. cucurbitae TaxID=2747967 RepID=A0ACD3ZH34_FUSSC|nr:hypothetical protein LCI18_011564 [Fusarium solani-melongenae]